MTAPQRFRLLYDPTMRNPEDIVAAAGLALGAVFGLVGTVVSAQPVRAASWAIDSIGLVVATALLALSTSGKETTAQLPAFSYSP